MNHTYKAGDSVTIVMPDPAFSEIPNQQNKVGTVTAATPAGGVYVSFPDVPDSDYYYLPGEFAPTRKFEVGDRVAYAGPFPEFQGQESTVIGYEHGRVKVRVTKSADKGAWCDDRVGDVAHYKEDRLVPRDYAYLLSSAGLKVGDKVVGGNIVNFAQTGQVGTIRQSTSTRYLHVEFEDGSDYPYLPNEVTKYVEPPKPKKGDWVKVTGYSVREVGYEGRVGQIEAVGETLARVAFQDGSKFPHGTFKFQYLVKTEEPEPTAKFKKGDWVMITGWGGGWDGLVGPITDEAYSENRTHFKDHASVRTDKYGVGAFTENYLVAAEEPTPAPETHWAYTQPVGTVGVLQSRTVIKDSENSWLHLYLSDDGSKVNNSSRRSVKSTRNLLLASEPVFTPTVDKLHLG